MKVKELIKKLQKMPQDLEVCVRDHDQDHDEISGKIRSVEEIETVSDGLAVVLGS